MSSNDAVDPQASTRTIDADAICEAMCAATSAAVLEHKRMGESVVIWRNGRIEWVEPERIPDDGDLSKLH